MPAPTRNGTLNGTLVVNDAEALVLLRGEEFRGTGVIDLSGQLHKLGVDVQIQASAFQRVFFHKVHERLLFLETASTLAYAPGIGPHAGSGIETLAEDAALARLQLATAESAASAAASFFSGSLKDGAEFRANQTGIHRTLGKGAIARSIHGAKDETGSVGGRHNKSKQGDDAVSGEFHGG